MTTILSFVNLKGGVGKTALSVNFAAYCGQKGLKTLLVDLDPQTNATLSLMNIEKWEDHATKHGTVANLLGARSASAERGAKTVKDVLVEGIVPGVDLVPSHLELFTIDLDLGQAVARELRLRKALQPIVDDYQIVICDCPPNLTLPTQNAIALSTHYAVPISPDFLSGIGVGLVVSRVKLISDALDHKIDLAGIVVSRVGRPSQHRKNIIAEVRKQFGDAVLNPEIKERSAVSEAAAKNVPVFSISTEAASDFAAVGDELLERLGIKT